jgi:hypothetical protein
MTRLARHHVVDRHDAELTGSSPERAGSNCTYRILR